MAVGKDVVIEDKGPLFYLIPIGSKAQSKAPSIAAEVRSRDARCIIETTGKNFKKALNSALGAGATYLIIIGDEEIEREVISLKVLSSGEQTEIKTEELGNFIEQNL